MDNAKIGQEISSAFELDIPPVAMSLVGEQPQGIEVMEEEVPSFCTFWRMAEKPPPPIVCR